MSKRVKRDPSFQAKLMVEGFGAETALRHAEAMYQKLTTPAHRDYWGQVLRAVRLFLPPPPPPPKPKELTPLERAERWIMGTGYVYQVVDGGKMSKADGGELGAYIRIPVHQSAFGYFPNK